MLGQGCCAIQCPGLCVWALAPLNSTLVFICYEEQKRNFIKKRKSLDLIIKGTKVFPNPLAAACFWVKLVTKKVLQ